MNKIMKLASVPKVLIGIALISFLFSMDLSISQTLLLIEIDESVLLGMLFFVLANLVKYLRILVLISYNQSQKTELQLINLRASLQGFFATGLLILLLPFKLGEVFRVGFVSKFLMMPVSRAIFTVATERFIDLTVLSIMCFGFVAFIHPIDAFKIEYIFTALIFASTLLFTLLAITKLLMVHYETKYWHQPRQRVAEFIGQRLLDWNVIKNNISSNFISIVVFTFVAWTLEISSLALIFSNTGLSNIDLVVLALFCLLGFALPAGPAGIGGVHLAFYSFNMLMSENLDINYANLYLLYNHITLFLMLLLTSLWRMKV